MGLTEALCHYNTLFINQCSYFGIFGLMALESMIAPIPSELVMPFAGFLIFMGHFDVMPVIVASRSEAMERSAMDRLLQSIHLEPPATREKRPFARAPHLAQTTINR